MSAHLDCDGRQFPLDLTVATGFLSRLRGWLFRGPPSPREALLLTECSSIHTAMMGFPIDVLHLDGQGHVLAAQARLQPWRLSFGPRGTRQILELPAGTLSRQGIGVGHRLKQSGAAMIEFAVVGPMIALIGLALLQYGLLFFGKNQINHATFMGARAGTTAHASLTAIRESYVEALIPLYGGGRNDEELDQARQRASDQVDRFVRIELLNPTRESFDDWQDARASSPAGQRVIPQSDIALRDPARIGTSSGQNIFDANLIKVKVTHGIEPQVPLLGRIYTRYLQWLDSGEDPFHTYLVGEGRIPVVSQATLHMQSDPWEPANPVSVPGRGNDGNPQNPGDPPHRGGDAPRCETLGCSLTPLDPGGGGDGGGAGCVGDHCPPCGV